MVLALPPYRLSPDPAVHALHGNAGGSSRLVLASLTTTKLALGIKWANMGTCRVQFDRRELGVELVKDVDVMPIDPHESLPSGIQLNAVRLAPCRLVISYVAVSF